MKKNVFAKVALIAAAGFAVNALAAPNPATATFDVKIKIVKACSVVAGAASVIDFASQDASAVNLQGTSSINITCSKKTAYTIGLVPSNASAVGAGVMNSLVISPADTVAYQLRQVTGAAGAVWGNTVGTNTVAGIGTGAVIATSVFATVPSANSTPADYIDTVTVSVVY
jgi:spore coat protein U-like protein